MADNDKAVVLLSGGLDSSTVLKIATAKHSDVYALSFRYGQRHSVELDCARRVADLAKVANHVIVDIDLQQFGGSALTDDIDVPKDRSDSEMADEIPITYVPARNTIFLSFALAWAEVLKADNIYLGVNAVDYSGYPDCRPEFITAFQTMANLATKAGVEGRCIKIQTPLIDLSKSEIIRKGVELGVDYALTVSCYQADDNGRACGKCDSCRLRRAGFVDAGMKDPTIYSE